MLGFLFRLLGCLVLASAAVFAIGDIARSLSADALRLTTVSEAWALLVEGEGATGALPAVLAAASSWPVSPALTAIAALLILAGRRRRAPLYRI